MLTNLQTDDIYIYIEVYFGNESISELLQIKIDEKLRQNKVMGVCLACELVNRHGKVETLT